MKTEIITDYNFDQNCYLVYENQKGFLIDPAGSAEKAKKRAEELGIAIEAILLTHAHYDHISGADSVAEALGIPVYGSKACGKNAVTALNVCGLFGKDFSLKARVLPFSDGETKKIAGIDVTCIHTPGHSDCSVCYLAEDVLFSGDTLFCRTVGRWDFPNGDEDTLKQSIRTKLYTLSDELAVYPGHGEKTTVGYEKKFNLVIKEE